MKWKVFAFIFSLFMVSEIDDMFFFSYEYVLPYILVTPDGWHTTKIIAIVLIYLAGDKYGHDRIKGMVTATEIKRTGESLGISFEEVISIRGEILVANLFYPDVKLTAADAEKEAEFCVTGKSLIPLIRTRLNQWSINKDSFSIKPAKAMESMIIEYAPIGRYAWPLSYLTVDWFIVLMTIVGTSYGLRGFYRPLLIPLGVLLVIKLLFGKGLELYRKIRIRLTPNEIMMINAQGIEYSMAFSEVTRVEKGFFQVKLTGKSGQVIFLPRGCYLLPELIEELAGIEKA